MSEFPSIFTQARSLAKDLWETRKAMGADLPVIVPDEVGLARLELCENCEELDKESYRCKKCGCGMKIKTQLAVVKCPLDKWQKYEVESA